MPMPQERSIEIYLLHEIEMRGGSVRAGDPAIREAVAKHFPLLTQDDRELPNVGTGANKWGNRVDFTRLELVHKGEMDGSQRGVWPITEKGRDRLSREWPPAQPPQYSTKLYTERPRYRKGSEEPTRRPTRPTQFEPSQALQPEPSSAPVEPMHERPPTERPVEPIADVEETTREQLLTRLNSMNDREFENFVGRLLAELGYDNVDVVGRSGDGGVDVRCVLKGPLIEPPVTVVCQVKRHASNIGPSAVGDLRGRWAHRADRLILINTAGFTHGAKEAAKEQGAKEVSLVSGEGLADLVIEKGIGVIKEPVIVEKLDETFWGDFSA